MASKPEPAVTGLALLRQPFPPNQISKLPKESRKQSDERKNRVAGCMVWKCPECGGPHHKDATHLDYVGHAALTDRLLDADPEWNWEPIVMDGLPSPGNGMWIKLTVCGVSRIGYGAADGKTGGDAIKEIIGDGLRNAAMRFGAALDLWHKGDLHADEGDNDADATSPEVAAQERDNEPKSMPDAEWAELVNWAKAADVSSQELTKHYKVDNVRHLNQDQYTDAISMLKGVVERKVKAETNVKAIQNGDHFGIDDSVNFGKART